MIRYCEVPGALRVHAVAIFFRDVYSSEAFSAGHHRRLSGAARRARRFECVRWLRDVFRRPKSPPRLENSRFEVGVARSARNAARRRTHRCSQEKLKTPATQTRLRSPPLRGGSSRDVGRLGAARCRPYRFPERVFMDHARSFRQGV
jgi:hypothetical protein